MNIQDKIIVISGAASGMGAATVKKLAQENARVALFDRNEEVIQQIAKEVDGFAQACDVRSAESVEFAVKAVTHHYGAIHGCVNCAGIAPAARVVGRQGPLSLAAFNEVIQVNLVGSFNLLRLCAAQMITQNAVNSEGERGVIVNTASIAAFEGQIGQAAYSASKGGIVGMTLPIARELAQFGIRVMTIAPGVMDTPMVDKMPIEVKTRLYQAVPFPKRLGLAHEFAALVKDIFLNAYLNGSVIRLDGGLRMQ